MVSNKFDHKIQWQLKLTMPKFDANEEFNDADCKGKPTKSSNLFYRFSENIEPKVRNLFAFSQPPFRYKAGLLVL